MCTRVEQCSRKAAPYAHIEEEFVHAPDWPPAVTAPTSLAELMRQEVPPTSPSAVQSLPGCKEEEELEPHPLRLPNLEDHNDTYMPTMDFAGEPLDSPKSPTVPLLAASLVFEEAAKRKPRSASQNSLEPSQGSGAQDHVLETTIL